MFRQTDPPQVSQEEINLALVECLKIAAQRGRQLRLERERAAMQVAEPQTTTQEAGSSVVEMSHEEFMVWADEQSRFIERIHTFLENLKAHKPLVDRFSQIDDCLSSTEADQVIEILQHPMEKAEIDKIDEIIRGCDWLRKVEEGRKILAQPENHKNQAQVT